jgi:hypothetical protein
MNRREILKNARLDAPVVSQEFRNIYIKHKNQDKLNDYFYCFYEGKDDSKYYNHRIEGLCEREVSHLHTDGKENLLKIYRILDRRKRTYQHSQLLFFIDRDYDFFIKPNELIDLEKISNLYITPTYSIENFYTTKKAFARIVKSEFHIVETDEKFDKLINLFLERQKEFHQIILDINSWIATQNYFLFTKEERNIPYNELKLDKILKISLQNVESKHQSIVEFLENKFAESFLMEDEEIDNKFQELKALFSENNFQIIFRGKFEIDFLNKFLKLLVEEANQKDGKGLNFIDINEKIKTNLSLADNPECLKEFIYNFDK